MIDDGHKPGESAEELYRGGGRAARYGLGIALGLIGLWLNSIDLELLTRETPLFVLGGAPVLLAFVLGGPGPGLLAAAIALSSTVLAAFGFEPSLAAVGLLYTLEAMVVYLAYRRFPSLVLGVLLFWLIVGWGLDLIVYRWWIGLSLDYTLLVYLKQVLNGLLNAALAEIILMLPWHRWLPWTFPGHRVSGLASHLFRQAVLGVMLVSLPLVFVATRALFDRDLELSFARQTLVAREIAALGQRFVENAIHDVELLATRISADGSPGRTVEGERLEQALRARQDLLALRILDREGEVLASARSEAWSHDLDPTWSHSELSAGPVSSVAIGRSHGPGGATNGVIRVVANIDGNPEGQRLEVLFDLSPLRPQISSQRLHPGESVTLVGENGLIFTQRSRLQEGLGEELRQYLAAGENEFSYYLPEDESLESRLALDLHHAVVEGFGPPPLKIMVDVPANTLHTRVRHSVVWVIFFLFGNLGILYVILGLLARRVAEPLTRLKEASVEIAQGRFPPAENFEHLSSHPVSEVRQLATNFSEMRKALASRDLLTGLANRERFEELLRARLLEKPQSLAVIHLDLDEFRDVEGMVGRGGTDRILRRVARRLEHALYPDDVCARLGGDEFVILADKVGDVEQVTAVVRRLREALSRPFEVDGREIFLTASLGVGLYPVDAESVGELLQNAHAAVLQAKEDGRDCWRVYAPEMHRRAEERLELLADLRRALDKGELSVHYQPIVDLQSGRVRRLEALARWHHSSRGMVPPAVFISLAESSGLISKVDDFIMNAALTDSREWPVDTMISLNVSARQLGEGEVSLDERIARALERFPIDAGNLELEITESFAIRDLRSGGALLERLGLLGIGLCIDDFGAGHASFAYLRSIPVDTIKLDRAYVADLSNDQVAVGIAKAVVVLGRELGMEVVAEGVETREQLDLVRELGFHYAQGFLLSRPVPAADVSRLLERIDLV